MTDVKAGKLSGGATVANYITGEDLSAQANGIIAEFTLDNAFVIGTLQVYFNGLRLRRGYDYTEGVGNILLLDFIPESDDIIIVDYFKI